MSEREEIRGNVQVYDGLAKALFKTFWGEVLLEDEQEKLEQWLQVSEEHREFYAFFHDPCNLSDALREHLADKLAAGEQVDWQGQVVEVTNQKNYRRLLRLVFE